MPQVVRSASVLVDRCSAGGALGRAEDGLRKTNQPAARQTRAAVLGAATIADSKIGQSPTLGLPHIDRQNGCPAGSA